MCRKAEYLGNCRARRPMDGQPCPASGSLILLAVGSRTLRRMGVAGLNGPPTYSPRISRKTPSEVTRSHVGTNLQEFCAKGMSIIRINSAMSHISSHARVTIGNHKSFNNIYLQTQNGLHQKSFAALLKNLAEFEKITLQFEGPIRTGNPTKQQALIRTMEERR